MVISTLTLVPGVMGGTERYVRELAVALRRQSLADRIHLLTSPLGDGFHSGLPEIPVERYGNATSDAGRALAMARFGLLPRNDIRHLVGARPGLIHYPLTTRIPRAGGTPSVATIHDVQHLVHPENFSRVERAYRRLFYDPALRESDLLIAISRHSADTLSALRGVSADRVRVVHLGVDVERFTPAPDVEREDFILYPANPWPHKNHARLFAAMPRIRAEHPDLTLVLTGAGTDTLPAMEGVIGRGRVSDDELLRLYRTARALVFPSLYEGFGMPVVEALACGCPVACSRVGALPEIAGAHATYFDPLNPESIAQGVVDCIRTTSEGAAQAGAEHAQGFSWERVAEAHCTVYAELLP